MPSARHPNGFDWTPGRVETLRRLWLDGKTAGEIADTLDGPSRNAVLGKVHRLKLPGRMLPHAENKPPKKTRLYQDPKKKKRRTLLALENGIPAFDSKFPVLSDTAPWQPLPHSVPKRLADLGEVGRLDSLGECHWPVGENPTLFCACATYGTYCPTHAAMSRRPKVAA